MVYHRWSAIALSLVLTSCSVFCFAPKAPAFVTRHALVTAVGGSYRCVRRFSSPESFAFDNDDEEDWEEDEEEEEEEDPYAQLASSEFMNTDSSASLTGPTTSVDWGGALGTLRDRIGDKKKGRVGPSNALFRLMTSQSPNEAIGAFVSQANPQVVAAMSGAVSSLLGGLTSPAMGVETIVKASGEKIGSLCFQLQMTGYMFRNAEYVLALKEIMNLKGSTALQDYKAAFDRLDMNGSGYIEAGEIEALLRDVYGDEQLPKFEVESFMRFFDANDDGRISWDEFERGLGKVTEKKSAMAIQKINSNQQALLPQDDIEEDDEEIETAEPSVSGLIEVELKDGTVIEVEAKDYIRDLKREAEALKEALIRETGQGQASPGGGLMPGESTVAPQSDDGMGGIASYISSLEGDVQSLTKGISPEIVEAMKLLVDYVIEGGPSTKKKNNPADKGQVEMEIPGSALQQLALWQLVLGYRLRESEATGEYLKLLE